MYRATYRLTPDLYTEIIPRHGCNVRILVTGISRKRWGALYTRRLRLHHIERSTYNPRIVLISHLGLCSLLHTPCGYAGIHVTPSVLHYFLMVCMIIRAYTCNISSRKGVALYTASATQYCMPPVSVTTSGMHKCNIPAIVTRTGLHHFRRT